LYRANQRPFFIRGHRLKANEGVKP
jgi:hypothetical protein